MGVRCKQKHIVYCLKVNNGESVSSYRDQAPIYKDQIMDKCSKIYVVAINQD